MKVSDAPPITRSPESLKRYVDASVQAPTPELAHPLLDRIEQSGELPDGVSAPGAFAVAVCLLTLRLTAEHAEELRHALPPELDALLAGSTSGRSERANRFGQDQFLEVLAEELGISHADAERVSAGVFGALREFLPQTKVVELATQLPKSLSALWCGGRGVRVKSG